MVRPIGMVCVSLLLAGTANAQEFYGDVGSESYLGQGSVGSQEPLFPYDDQEQWKHGYMQVIPYYGGYHSGRPYNYHHVFAQTQTSVGWGMPHGMPYSQQWWHRFESMADPGRVQTEPNGYYGYAPATTPGVHVARTPEAAALQSYIGEALPPGAVYPVSGLPGNVAPVQYVPGVAQYAPAPQMVPQRATRPAPVQAGYPGVPQHPGVYPQTPVYPQPGAYPQQTWVPAPAPAAVPHQTQQLRQYLATPGAY